MINLDRLKGFGLGIPDCQNYGNCGDRLCWNAAGLLVRTFHQENQS